MTDKAKDKAVTQAAAAMNGDQPAAAGKKKAKRKFSAKGWTAADDMLMLRRVQRFVEGVPEQGLDWLQMCVRRAIEARYASRREEMIASTTKAIEEAQQSGPLLPAVGQLNAGLI